MTNYSFKDGMDGLSGWIMADLWAGAVWAELRAVGFDLLVQYIVGCNLFLQFSHGGPIRFRVDVFLQNAHMYTCKVRNWEPGLEVEIPGTVWHVWLKSSLRAAYCSSKQVQMQHNLGYVAFWLQVISFSCFSPLQEKDIEENDILSPFLFYFIFF